MKKILIALSVSLIIVQVSADNVLQTKTFAKDNGWRIGVSKEIRAQKGGITMKDGEVTIQHPGIKTTSYSLQINKTVKLEVGKQYKLAFDATVNAPCRIEIVYATKKPPYLVYCRTWVNLTPDKKRYGHILDIKTKKGQASTNRPCMIRIYFGVNKKFTATLKDISIQLTK